MAVMQLKVNGFQKVLRLNQKMWNTRPGTYNIFWTHGALKALLNPSSTRPIKWHYTAVAI